MKILKIKILKKCSDPSGRHKGDFLPGKVITYSGEKVKVGKELIKEGNAKQIDVKRHQVDSVEQAEKVIEKLSKKSK